MASTPVAGIRRDTCGALAATTPGRPRLDVVWQIYAPDSVMIRFFPKQQLGGKGGE